MKKKSNAPIAANLFRLALVCAKLKLRLMLKRLQIDVILYYYKTSGQQKDTKTRLQKS